MEKKHYTGLYTRRIVAECEPLMVTSQAKLKVKTATATDEWREEDGGMLATSITTTLE